MLLKSNSLGHDEQMSEIMGTGIQDHEGHRVFTACNSRTDLEVGAV